jgi:cytochrome b pre-mRNA-processing protein 3
MLGFLFRTLTADSQRGAPLFDALTAKAREKHWYVEGTVPDTIDGRFAVLATLAAMVLVRLEQLGEEGNAAAVALSERFIEVMESEHRELGIGDPTLGRTVRKLVSSLAKRTELWRGALTGDREWNEASRESLYREGVSPEALRHSAEALKSFWHKLQGAGVDSLQDGKLR